MYAVEEQKGNLGSDVLLLNDFMLLTSFLCLDNGFWLKCARSTTKTWLTTMQGWLLDYRLQRCHGSLNLSHTFKSAFLKFALILPVP